MTRNAKELHFPLAGVDASRSFREGTRPEEGRVYATPYAVNVRGDDAFGQRRRGGSRPALSIVGEDVVVTTGAWAWPNGEALEWPGSAGEIEYTLRESVQHLPDGAAILDPHKAAQASALPGAELAAFYRGRVVASIGTQWYASAIGDAGDWDFGKDAGDASRAVSGNLALANRMGEGITAIIPQGDERLYLATARSLWVMEDAAQGVRRVSEVVGCVGANAWCFVADTLFLLSTQGLFALAPGERAPRHVDGALPSALQGCEGNALIGYEPKRNAVHLFTDNGDFYYDVSAGAFWPQLYPDFSRPLSLGRCVFAGVDETLLLGSDGVWRFFDEAGVERVESSVVIGPFRCSVADDKDGMLDTLSVTLAAEGGGDVRVGVCGGKTAEEAAQNAKLRRTLYEYTVDAGINTLCRPRARCAWCAICVNAVGAWALEAMTARIKQLGELR